MPVRRPHVRTVPRPRVARMAAALALGTLAAAAAARADDCRLPDPDAPAAAMGTAIKAFVAAGCHLGWVHDYYPMRPTSSNEALAPHGRVTIYYSPAMVDWLKSGRPQTPIADQALMVKQMYDYDTCAKGGAAVMYKAGARSLSGWFWGGGNAFLGQGCVFCHASADNAQQTFADFGNIDGSIRPPQVPPDKRCAPWEGGGGLAAAAPVQDQPSVQDQAQPPAGTGGSGPSAGPASGPRLPPGDSQPDPGFAALLRPPAGYPGASANPGAFVFPDWNLGRAFVAGPLGPDLFLHSANCLGCHDADSGPCSDYLDPKGGGTTDPMAVLKSGRCDTSPNAANPWWDVSPFAEMTASMMGLSGRDPVFHAQLESEKALRPAQTAFLDDTCYRCHGVMGQRQIHLDAGKPFEHFMVYAQGSGPAAKYGALARDGITCAVCHRVSERGLGEPATFTGLFNTLSATEMVGPYSDDLKTLPMRNALGITPDGEDYIRESRLCGTCHTVILPRIPEGFARGAGPDDEIPVLARTHDPESSIESGHEQTTFPEWQNSGYPARGLQCQGCHMPNAIDGRPIQTRLAVIEGPIPDIRNALPDGAIELPVRSDYGRHTLVGLNYTVLGLFRQFPDILGGLPDTAWGDPDRVPAIELSLAETQGLAASAAQIAIEGPPRMRGGALETQVRVRSLAGHKFPSGVGFRRLWIELGVLDAEGRPIWTSGGASPLGVILGADGRPLPSEFTRDPKAIQPHRSIVESQDQVQIYEERSVDNLGVLTTSFLGLFDTVKDNRLLPQGWNDGGPSYLQPVAVGEDPDYRNGQGEDRLVYRVPLAALAGRTPARVRARLYYQSIPPYYLQDRFELGDGPETARLYYLASRLKVAGTPIEGWRLQVGAAAEAEVRR